MTHSEKVEAARRQLTGSGVAESNWAPPLWKLLAVAGGSLFGVFMALYHRRMARKHRLPAWSDYAGDSAPDGRPVP